jgi:hypothetical protein
MSERCGDLALARRSITENTFSHALCTDLITPFLLFSSTRKTLAMVAL